MSIISLHKKYTVLFMEVLKDVMQNNWSIGQTQKLFSYALQAQEEKKGLMWAFIKLSEESGRSVNSIRNYYYSQLKMFELVPKLAEDLGITIANSNRTQFELFKNTEIDELVKSILIGKANGKSVRATIAHLSDGDSKLGLRLQNKYRSMITHHKSKVNVLMQEMATEGIIFYNPYTKSVVTEATPDNHKKLADYIGSLNETEVDNFFLLMQKLFA